MISMRLSCLPVRTPVWTGGLLCPRNLPVISKVDNVSRGENFNIIIFFNSYGADKDQMVDITYDFRMIRPTARQADVKKIA
jgi:hypothetical protein